MALIPTSVSRLGQANQAGDADALFLKVFSGEIITTFEKNNVMMPLHRVRTIQNGKSATFPTTGVASAGYHTPGESVLQQGTTGTTLYGSTASASYSSSATSTVESNNGITAKYLSKFNHNEKIVYIDDVLLSSVFVADIDEMKNHYDVRSVYSTEIGRALAYAADKNLLRTVIAGARKTTDRFGGSSTDYLGSRINLGTYSSATDAEIITGLFSAAEKMDNAGVPQDDRFAVLTPNAYYKLIQGQSDAINRDYNDNNGSVASGVVFRVAGIQILKSPNLPSGDESSTQSTLHGAAGVKNDVNGTADAGYSGLNYSTTRGIVFHREAVATVKLMDLSLETDYITERLGTLMLAKYAMGHNILREECCYELYGA
jgi:hypothetical protein